MLQMTLFAGILGMAAFFALLFPRGRAEAALDPRRFANSREGDECPVLEVLPEENEEPSSRHFVPLRFTRLTGEIADAGARLTLTQIFRFSGEVFSHTIQALYRFPLPGDAAVVGVKVFWKDFELETELKERKKAEGDYKKALKKGRAAALLMREAPDIFTLAVAGIDPDEDVRVETTYVQCPRREKAGWSLRVPLTMGPRYVREEETGPAASGQPLALFRDPGHRFSCEVALEAGRNPTSPTHGVLVTPLAAPNSETPKVLVTLAGGEVLPDRDFVLTWAPEPQETAVTLSVRTADLGDEERRTAFSALVVPPTMPETPLLPREMVLLVDHSGSMEGAKWEATDWAVRRFLENLREEDRFVVGVFHSTTAWMASTLLPATPKNVARGIQFVLGRRDVGGTELGQAMEEALAYPRSRGDFSRHLVILTDAEVTDADSLIHLADREFSRKYRRRISVLCIDSSPHEFLARSLAERGGGEVAFLTSAPDEEDMTTALEELLASWNSPLALNCRLVLNRRWGVVPGRRREGGGAFSRIAETSVDLGDLLPGRPVLVTGMVERDEEPLEARLIAGEGEMGKELARSTARAAVEDEQIPLRTVVGSRLLTELEHIVHGWPDSGKKKGGNVIYDPRSSSFCTSSPEVLEQQLRSLGYDLKELGDDPAKTSGGSPHRISKKTLTRLLVREAKHFGVACEALAFVAVHRERGNVVIKTALVPNALPEGWSETFLSAPSPRDPQPCAGAPFFCMAALASAPLQKISRTFCFKSKNYVRAPLSAARDEAASSPWELFRGTPPPGNEVVLFDLDASPEKGASGGFSGAEAVLCAIGASWIGKGGPEDGELLLFVGDLTLPRLRLNLKDVLAATKGSSGGRPVNLRWRSGEPFRLVLRTPTPLPPEAALSVWWRPR